MSNSTDEYLIEVDGRVREKEAESADDTVSQCKHSLPESELNH